MGNLIGHAHGQAASTRPCSCWKIRAAADIDAWRKPTISFVSGRAGPSSAGDTAAAVSFDVTGDPSRPHEVHEAIVNRIVFNRSPGNFPAKQAYAKKGCFQDLKVKRAVR